MTVYTTGAHMSVVVPFPHRNRRGMVQSLCDIVGDKRNCQWDWSMLIGEDDGDSGS